MTISLAKGERASLSKGVGHNFGVGLGWDAAAPGGASMDLDASAFILAGDKLPSDKHFVYYNNLKGPGDAVIHTGDNLTGDGAGDDEKILINLDKLDPTIDEVSVIVSIYEGISKGQNFGQVKNAYIRICELNADGSFGNEVMRADLEEDYSAYTVLQFGSIYKKNDEWKFQFAGNGYKADLGAVVQQYANTATA
jgi:tellurium resistance protein TerD